MVVTANLDHIVRLSVDRQFRSAYEWASVATIDGWPVLLYTRLRRWTRASRVTGSDLFVDLMLSLDPREDRLFVVATNDQVVERLGRWAQQRKFALDAVAFAVPDFGFECRDVESNTLAARIRRHGTTHLIMGVGAPKSETWCYEHRNALGDCHILCVGAGVEFFTGLKRRAPTLVRSVGLECVWRLVQEPNRLFRRYVVDSWGFFRAVWLDLNARQVEPNGRDELLPRSLQS